MSAGWRLRDLRNLGPKSEAMLARAGVSTPADLERLGAVRALKALVVAGASPNLNLLWAMEGALTDRDWRVVAREDRLRLPLELDALGVKI